MLVQVIFCSLLILVFFEFFFFYNRIADRRYGGSPTKNSTKYEIAVVCDPSIFFGTKKMSKLNIPFG